MVKKKVKSSKKKIYFISLGIAVLLIVGVLYLMYPKDCGSDQECFFSKSQECSPTKIDLFKPGGYYQYKVHGDKSDQCIVSVHLLKVSDAVQPDKKAKLENKRMTCKVPMKDMSNNLVEYEELSQYCSGPLKEAILEITLERLYGVVASNLGEVTMGFQDALDTTKK